MNCISVYYAIVNKLRSLFKQYEYHQGLLEFLAPWWFLDHLPKSQPYSIIMLNASQQDSWHDRSLSRGLPDDWIPPIPRMDAQMLVSAPDQLNRVVQSVMAHPSPHCFSTAVPIIRRESFLFGPCICYDADEINAYRFHARRQYEHDDHLRFPLSRYRASTRSEDVV